MQEQLSRLEVRLRRTQGLAACAVGGLGIAIALGLGGQPQVQDVVRARRIELVDDAGVVRLRLNQDALDTGRRSRAAGLTVYDAKGNERGGFSTMDDGSVVLAMDAPKGVGSPMPDRLGLRVAPDGSSHVMLLDNETRAVVKLHSDGKGGGGPQVFKWDMENKKVGIKTLTFDGEKTESQPLGG